MDTKSNILKPPSEPREFGFFVDGKWVAAGKRDVLERSSPGHGVPVTRIPLAMMDYSEEGTSEEALPPL